MAFNRILSMKVFWYTMLVIINLYCFASFTSKGIYFSGSNDVISTIIASLMVFFILVTSICAIVSMILNKVKFMEASYMIGIISFIIILTMQLVCDF